VVSGGPFHSTRFLLAFDSRRAYFRRMRRTPEQIGAMKGHLVVCADCTAGDYCAAGRALGVDTWIPADYPSGPGPELSVTVERAMPAEIEAALALLARSAGVPADGEQHRITLDLVIMPDGRVRGAVLT
jgi:hypothetical protein